MMQTLPDGLQGEIRFFVTRIYNFIKHIFMSTLIVISGNSAYPKKTDLIPKV